jgi:hypothetical protein
MFQKRTIWRVLFGMIAGAFGGFSLARTLFPIVALNFLGSMSLEGLINVREVSTTVVVLWAISAGVVSWYGGMRLGAYVLGGCGLVSGVILGYAIAPGDPLALIIGMALGFIYGLPGGLIMGRLFPQAAPAVG